MNLEQHIRNVENFPKQGIQFKDINPLLNNPEAFRESIKALSRLYSVDSYDTIGAFDARGFIFGAALAYETNKPFFPLRKAGKLPYETLQESYDLEYGSNTIEVQIDAIQPGDKVLLIDDLLATGGTMKAGCNLVEKLGGEVRGIGFVIELPGLGGQELLSNYKVKSLINYDRR